MKCRTILCLLTALATSALLAACRAGTPGGAAPMEEISQAGQGCSVIYATDGEMMLGGNNEDYLNPRSNVWFIPGEGEGYGRMYFGFDDYRAQGGMNEQGLFFDALGLDEAYPVPTEGKQAYAGNLTDKIMTECATVDCAIGMFESFYHHTFWNWQFMFGDATGVSAIIEPGAVIRQQGGTQVATNFLQSSLPPTEYTDKRYLTATAAFESMGDLTVEGMRDILDGIHVESGSYTLYSNVYDLNNKLVYLYYFHNYDDVVVLDLDQELAQGYHATALPSLFPANEAAERWAQPKWLVYDSLVEEKADSNLRGAYLQAYAGEYAMLPGWGEEGELLTVIAEENSLVMRFPDYHQYVLYPSAPNEFFSIFFADGSFEIVFEVHFGVSEEGRILYMELLMGEAAYRGDRIGAEAFVLPTPTLAPTAVATATVKVNTPTARAAPVEEELRLSSQCVGTIIGLAAAVILVIVWSLLRRRKPTGGR